MPDMHERIARLSPARRALLEAHLMQRGAASPADDAIPRRQSTAPCALSFAQQRLWFLAQLDPQSPLYNERRALRLHGALNIACLQQALQAVVARHEALRTTFVANDGTPMQVVHEPRAVALPIVDLRALPASARETEVQRQIAAAVQRPFDLTSDVLLRPLLVHLEDEDYVLLLVTHHIASDGWSTGILFRDITACYGALVTGDPAACPALPIQYADYALWQRQWLQGERLHTQLAYWKQQLASAPARLELPTDHPRPALQSWHGTRQAWPLPDALATDLKRFSQAHGATLFMTLLAALHTLLYRYTGQEDIVVGAPIAGRSRQETEHVIGFFVNTLALRARFTDTLTFLELLGQVRAVTLGAYDHQDFPFEKLVEELQPERSLSHAPLLQVLFAFQNVPRALLTLPAVAVQEFEVERTVAKFDLALYMSETVGGLQTEWEYNTDLFEAETIARMAGHFQTVLEGLLVTPGIPIAQLPLLTETERRQLLVVWNDTAMAYPREKRIPQLFEEQVERTPDAVAVLFAKQHLTYHELNSRANQLASYLRTLGVGPETLVGICLHRSIELLVSILAILKAGGTYMPLDPAYPRERRQFMLEDSAATLLITQHAQEMLPSQHAVRTVHLETAWPMLDAMPPENLPPQGTPEHLAYILYTSGSTGRPKGVAMPHRPLVNLLSWHQRHPRLQQAARTLQFAPVSFDVSLQDIVATWCTGGSVVLVADAIRRDPVALLQSIEALAIERLYLPFAALQQLAQAFCRAPGTLPRLRDIISAGEMLLLTDEIRQLLAHAPQCQLHNHYGPTECHVVTSYTMTRSLIDWPREAPIGRPVTNAKVYVLDSHCQPVPVGVPGELFIGGESIARGYHRRAALTHECFVPDPFCETAGARLYKTGDLARCQSDGTLVYLGRRDQQVKVRGYRVELGEIEAVLAEHPALTQTAVVLREDRPGDQRLVGYFVAAQPGQVSPGALSAYLRQRLPEYMIPATLVEQTAFPLTPNGKLDWRALPVPDSARPELNSSYVAPRDALEAQIAQTWEHTLDVAPIGIHDNFFALGGHSLLAVRLCMRLEQTCRVTLPLAMLFQAPTVAQLSDRLRQRDATLSLQRLLVYRPGGSKPPFFCVHGVELLGQYLDAEQPFYLLHPYAFDGQCAPDTVEAMAAAYLTEVQTVQPEGPYFLGGASIGGLIAFEMAQQLSEQGQTIACLVLMDPTSLYNSSAYRSQAKTRQSPWYKLLKESGRKILKRVAEQYLQHGRQVPLRLRMPYFVEVSLQAAKKYRLRRYPGSVILLTTAQRPTDLTQEWREVVAGSLESSTIPGDHFTMLQEPHVQVLAERLGTCLQQAQTLCHPGA